jgi:hypothetical protein
MIWFVDAHVHYHRDFGWRRFLDGAFVNLDRWVSAEAGDADVAGCLYFVDLSGEPSVLQLCERVEAGVDDLLPDGCELLPAGEPTARLLERPNGAPLVLVAGRQVATREGLEVLALSCGNAIIDGMEFGDTLDAALTAAAVTVVPWGFGKWWGARGRVVSRALAERRDRRVYLGDNGNRLAFGPPPALFGEAQSREVPVLPGSDPLPLSHHAARALEYGFRIEGDLDPGTPGQALRHHLDGLSEAPPVVGWRSGVARFATDQLRMQWHVRRRHRGAPGRQGGTS